MMVGGLGREGVTLQMVPNTSNVAILGNLKPSRERFQSRHGDTAIGLDASGGMRMRGDRDGLCL